MRIFGSEFGKRADVPPELQPYYETRARVPTEELLGPAALAAVLIFLVAALGGWVWQHGQGVSRQSELRVAQNSIPVTAPANKPVTAPSPAYSSNSFTPTSAPLSRADPVTSASPTLVNTGPGESALWLAAGAIAIGAAAGYMRSLRSVKISE